MRVTQRMLVDNVLANMNAGSEELSTLQDQLASGKRLRKPSDDPQALARALALHASSDRNAQYLRNISTVQGWLEATDGLLGEMEGIMQQARDAGLRGMSDTIGTDGKAQLAKQVDSFLEELLQSVNGTHEGKYLFAGQKTDTVPFVATRTGGEITSVTYAGTDTSVVSTAGQMLREISQDVDVVANVPGDQQVAGQAPLKAAIDGLINLRDWLNGSTSASAGMVNTTSALDGISALRATVGARSQRVSGAEAVLNEEKLNISTMLSRAEDADVAEVMTKLMMQENVYKAALQAGARVIQTSLLDYLQ